MVDNHTIVRSGLGRNSGIGKILSPPCLSFVPITIPHRFKTSARIYIRCGNWRCRTGQCFCQLSRGVDLGSGCRLLCSAKRYEQERESKEKSPQTAPYRFMMKKRRSSDHRDEDITIVIYSQVQEEKKRKEKKVENRSQALITDICNEQDAKAQNSGVECGI